MLTSAFDAIVVFVSIFVYWGDNFTLIIDPVILALVSLFVTSKVCDAILQGFKSAYKFEIITSNPEELSQEIMQKLHRGVTCMAAEGMYSHKNKSMLICVIRKRQLAELQRIIRRYPNVCLFYVDFRSVRSIFEVKKIPRKGELLMILNLSNKKPPRSVWLGAVNLLLKFSDLPYRSCAKSRVLCGCWGIADNRRK